MSTIGLKTLKNTVAKITPREREILTKYQEHIWALYLRDTAYHRSLWFDGRITKREYDTVAIPRLRKVRDELTQVARVLLPSK